MLTSTQVQSREILTRNADERRAVDDYPLYDLIGSYEKRHNDYWRQCPFHNGDGTTSFHVWQHAGHGWRFKCHVCGEMGNAADYLIGTGRAADFHTALIKLGIRASTGSVKPLPPRTTPTEPAKPSKLILPPPPLAAWQQPHHRLFECVELRNQLMQRYGFRDLMTLVRFGFGYVPKARQFGNAPAWTIPFDEEYEAPEDEMLDGDRRAWRIGAIQLRRADGQDEGERFKWWLPANKADHRVPARLFYADDCDRPADELWIVEGAFKAAAMWELGKRAIGVPGVATIGLLRGAAASGRLEGYETICVALDSDERGQAAATKIPTIIKRPCLNVRLSR